MKNKAEIRKTYKALRKLLSAEDIAKKSMDIANRLLDLPVWDENYYHVFLPIEEQQEVDTQFIMHILFGRDKNVVVSKSDFKTSGMTHYLLTDSTVLRKNAYNIPEPVEGVEVPAGMIDVIFVPLLAFDTAGNRIGYGKGFYDRFLANTREGAVKIGLSFFGPVDVFEDVFESDVKLDYCVTPERVYLFRS